MSQAVRYRFSEDTVEYYFQDSLQKLGSIVSRDRCLVVTDEHVFSKHRPKFKSWHTIVLKAGEEFKVQATVDSIIAQLLFLEADRNWTLVGIGGGVITDLTGFAASIYMRGLRLGFVPTTLLAMVDASIGGKNGIDIGPYKNLLGTIRQPSFLLYDLSLLQTLPESEWTNGFAEIIKHACIRDAAAFRMLEATDPPTLRRKTTALSALIQRNAKLKSRIVQKDEFEQGDRKLLNFGHTLGHAFETQYDLSHGQAVAIGMTCASMLSEHILGFTGHERVRSLLDQYGLPTFLRFDADKVYNVLKMDKKRAGKDMNFILLEKIGKGVVYKMPLAELGKRIRQIAST